MSITETRAAPLHLWREAETLNAQLFALFGAPERIAFQHTLTAKAHKLLAQWLRGAEALVRQLLLIEAAAFAPLPTPAPRQPKPATIREKRFIEHRLEHPEQWRVTFPVFMDRRRPAGSAGRRGRRRSMSERADDTWRYEMFDPDSPFSSPASGGSVGRAADDEEGGAQSAASSAAPSDRCAITSPASGGGKEKRFLSAWPLAERAEAILRVFNNPAPYAQRLARVLFAQPQRADAIFDAFANPRAHRGVIDPDVATNIRIECAAVFARQHADSS